MSYARWSHCDWYIWPDDTRLYIVHFSAETAHGFTEEQVWDMLCTGDWSSVPGADSAKDDELLSECASRWLVDYDQWRVEDGETT